MRLTVPTRAPVNTHVLLDQMVAILAPGTNDVFFWPFLESTGILVQSYKGEDESLIPSIAGAAKALNDPAAGFQPYMHPGGVHSYHFEAGLDQCLIGADAAKLSFNGTTDTAFSVGCFFYTEVALGALISKYNAADTAREWLLDVAAGPDIGLTLYDESATAPEGAITTTALSLRRWYMGVATYSGVGGDGAGAAGDGVLLYVDGAVVADTDVDDATYVDMEDTATELIIGATGDTAAPADEFTGRIALPFLVNAALSAGNIAALNGLGQQLLGLA